MSMTTHRASLEPATLDEALRFSTLLAKSTMIPDAFKGKPENVMVAIQWGRELGLGPLQALQNIAVINGRPTIWGDALIAMVRGSPLCQDLVETVTGEGDAMVASCIATRRGAMPVSRTFSVHDAQAAGLWSKPGPWKQYPKRMLQMRARGFALRDAFPDVLRGIITAEEAIDMPRDDFRGVTLDAAETMPLAEGPAQTRETINAEVAMDKAQKPTIAAWLDTLEADLQAAPDAAGVDSVVARDDVKNAQSALKGAALDRLNAMVKAALDRTAGEADGEVAP